MSEALHTPPRPVPLILGTAGLQGLALSLLVRAQETGTWPAHSQAWFSALLLVTVFLPPTIYALSESARQRQTWIFLGAVTGILLLVGIHQGLRVDTNSLDVTRPNPFGNALSAGAIVFLWLFHLLPFFQCRVESGQWWPNYQRLFFHAWRNALLLALTLMFFAVTWVLLWVLASLFDMLHLDLFKVLLFRAPRFSVMVLALAFGAGFFFTGSVDRLLFATRDQLLTVLKWLAVLATAILVIFSLALLMKSPELFASQQRVISATWLLWLGILTIYLYNAAYQDGTAAEPYPARVGAFLRFATLLLAVVCAMALYAVAVRIHAYGLTVSRFWALFVACTAMAYAAAYLWAALRASPWMANMGKANAAIAVALIVALLLSLTPALSPQRLSAASQMNLILADSTSDTGMGRYAVLRFQTGEYGLSALRRLSAVNGQPEQEQIRARALAALGAGSEWEYQQLNQRLLVPKFAVFPANSLVDDGLKAEVSKTTGANCATTACPALFIDLNGDGVQEVAVFTTCRAHLFRRQGARWKYLPSNVKTGAQKPCPNSTAREALLKGDYRVLDPTWRSLQVGSQTIDVEGN